jgi:hypothetical protein
MHNTSITKEEAAKILSGEIRTVYHRVYGEGEVIMARVDKLYNNQIRAEINFTIHDLLEDIKRPKFLFLTDPELSLNPWD